MTMSRNGTLLTWYTKTLDHHVLHLVLGLLPPYHSRLKHPNRPCPTSVCQVIKRSSYCAGDSPASAVQVLAPVLIMAGSKYTGRLMLLCQNAGKPLAKILPKATPQRINLLDHGREPHRYGKVFSLRWRFA